MDDNKKISIEQDAAVLANLLAKYSESEKIALSLALKNHSGVGLNIYNNPTCVAVALLPVVVDYQLKLVGVRRNIAPFIGGLALPGGFVDKGETAKVAAAREAWEETGIEVNPDYFKIIDERITNSNQLLQFCLYTEPLYANFVALNFTSSETQEVVLLNTADDLCFPLHNEVKSGYFNFKYDMRRLKM